jgi:hypothetical protein
VTQEKTRQQSSGETKATSQNTNDIIDQKRQQCRAELLQNVERQNFPYSPYSPHVKAAERNETPRTVFEALASKNTLQTDHPQRQFSFCSCVRTPVERRLVFESSQHSQHNLTFPAPPFQERTQEKGNAQSRKTAETKNSNDMI